jgi:hypothetical protein
MPDDHAEELDNIFGDTAAEETTPPPDGPPAEPSVDPEGDAHSAEPDAVADDKQPDSDTAPTAGASIDAELLAQAEAWGISRNAAERLGEAELAKEVNRLWARYAVQQSARTAAPQKNESDDLKAEIDAMKADTDGYDPKILKVLEATYERMKRFEQFAYQQTEAARQQQEQEAIRANDTATRLWDKLANEIDMPEVFGKGVYGKDIKEGSKFYENRARATHMTISLRDHFPDESDADLFHRASEILFGDTVKTKTENEIGKQLSARKTQFSVRPRTSKASAPKNEKEQFSEIYRKVLGSSAREQTVEEMLGG